MQNSTALEDNSSREGQIVLIACWSFFEACDLVEQRRKIQLKSRDNEGHRTLWESNYCGSELARDAHREQARSHNVTSINKVGFLLLNGLSGTDRRTRMAAVVDFCSVI